MARWVLGCPECKEEFTHSEIHAGFSLRSLFFKEEKPEMPDAGVNLECPNCKKTSLYRRDQLIYRAT